MLQILPWLFPALAALTLFGVPAYAWRIRGRRYAIFGGIVIGISLPGALIVHARIADWMAAGASEAALPWLHAGFAYCMAAAGVHFTSLVRARMRDRLFRLGVSVPGQFFIAAGFMAGVWLLALLPFRLVFWMLDWNGVLDAMRWLDLAPYLVAAISIFTSIRPVTELVRVRLGIEGPEQTTRVPVERHRRRTPAPLETRPLRIVQITDPHLGPWQSIASLQRILEGLLAKEPDLVLLTGDFLTMESSGTPGALASALEPVRRLSDRSYAIFGNHDHAASDEVRSALQRVGVRLLVDEEVVAHTPVGPVQILGADYVGKGRAEHLAELFARHPRRLNHLRLLLLHDPLGFHDVPEGEADLTLSGHTHGGQVGLVSFGLDWTVLSHSRWPDHGLFARGANRLYVHRGTGFYGFPLRIGVPGEASLIEVVVEGAAA